MKAPSRSLTPRAVVLSLLVCRSAQASSEPDAFIRASMREEHGAGASECPRATDLAGAVEQRLGRPVFVGEKDADMGVAATWSRREPGGFSVRVSLSTKDGLALGTRTLQTEADKCADLHESLALVLALMLDVSRAEFQEQQAQAAERERERLVPREPSPILVPEQAEPSSPRDAWASSVFATLSHGRLPGTTLGLRTRLYWRPTAFWGTALDVSYFFEEIERAGDAGSSFSAITVGVSLCPLEGESGVLRGALCTGVIAGRIRAQGFGFLFNRTASRMTLDFAARGALAVRFAPPFTLELGAEGWVNTQQHQFFHTDADGLERELFSLPLFGAAAELGLGLSFE